MVNNFMPRKIIDEFTDLPVSRQRKKQMRWEQHSHGHLPRDKALYRDQLPVETLIARRTANLAEET